MRDRRAVVADLTQQPALVVCGCRAGDVHPMARELQGVGRWTVISIVWPEDAEALDGALALPAAGCVLMAEEATAAPELGQRLAGRDARTPLVAIGGDPGASRGASCWLAHPPPTPVLAALLDQLAPAAPGRMPAPRLLGMSPAIAEVQRAIERVAGSPTPVLVSGEPGVGKELVARLIHERSRPGRPFAVVACVGASDEQLADEIASGFQKADGGTLFLDEIADLSLAVQAKVLALLETADVRLVSATARRLEPDVRRGKLREDFYYKVRGYHIPIAPLRERPEDVPPLTAHWLDVLAVRERRAPPVLERAAMVKLLSHDWPGNVRELVSVLGRALLAAGRGPIEAAHIDIPEDSQPIVISYREAKQRFEAAYYRQLLRTAKGNVSLAAKLADKTRKEVYDSLRRLNMEPNSFRAASNE